MVSMVNQHGFAQALDSALLEFSGPAAVAAICDACVAFLPVTGAGVTVMMSVNTQHPVYASDPVAAQIDAAQFALGEGPGLDAFRSGQPVLVRDIAAARETRWPAFAVAMSENSRARAICVFPLRVGARRLGVLNVYRDSPGVLESVELAAALRATDSVVLALLERIEESVPMSSEIPIGDINDGGRRADRRNGHGWLGTDVLYRAEVHQATGMITEQAGIDAAAALARLRAAAFASGRPIEDLALDVLARRVRFEPDGVTSSGDERTGPGDDTPG